MECIKKGTPVVINVNVLQAIHGAAYHAYKTAQLIWKEHSALMIVDASQGMRIVVELVYKIVGKIN